VEQNVRRKEKMLWEKKLFRLVGTDGQRVGVMGKWGAHTLKGRNCNDGSRHLSRTYGKPRPSESESGRVVGNRAGSLKDGARRKFKAKTRCRSVLVGGKGGGCGAEELVATGDYREPPPRH